MTEEKIVKPALTNKEFQAKCAKAGIRYTDALWNSYIDKLWTSFVSDHPNAVRVNIWA